MKKANWVTRMVLFVITALVLLVVMLSPVVKATEDTQKEDVSAVTTESKTSKKGRKHTSKAKYESLTDEEKEALKAEKEAKKAERKAKYESLTDEEKEALKAERKAKKAEKKAKYESLTNEEKDASKNTKRDKSNTENSPRAKK